MNPEWRLSTLCAACVVAMALGLSACGGGGSETPSTGPGTGNNAAPTIGGTPATTARAGVAYSFQPNAADADGDSMTFSITNKPSWLNINTTTGALTGTPSGGDVGDTASMTITVSDGRASTSLAAFRIHVDPTGSPGSNAAPTIGGLPGTTATVNKSYRFTPTAADSNGDPLTFAIANKPAWATFNTSTGRLSGTPSTTHVGTTSGISISVSDGKVTTSLAAFSITVSSAPVIVSGAPRVLYTDLVAGPTSGGENNLGAYVSIFGTNFGNNAGQVRVYFGTTEAAAYHYFGPSKGRSDVQQITVQPGNVGSGTLAIKVVVNGITSNTDHTFLVNPGDILFVDNVNGNDSTAAKGDINRPWRTVQTSNEGGALGQAGPGDVIVLRGKATWTDVGFEDHWIRFRHAAGTQPTGAAGTGYVTVQAYPKEDVHYVPPGDTHGGIHGLGSTYPQFADWIVISGLHIESVATSSTDGAPINLQANSDHWRVVNNELGPWPANDGAKAGGLVGNGTDVKMLGNHIHDIDGGTLNHGIYLDTAASDVEIAYNDIHDVSSGNLIQTFDNLGGGNITDLSIHHNLIHDGGRYGLNMADGTVSVHAYNNVIYNTAFAGIRINQNSASLSQTYEHNTLYNVCTDKSGGAIENTWSATSGSVMFQYNIVAEGSTASCSSGYSNSGSDSAISLSRNQWVGYNAPGKDGNPLTSAVLFVAANLFDFHLQSGSPAIDAAVSSLMDDDFLSNPRNGTPDLGAYER